MFANINYIKKDNEFVFEFEYIYYLIKNNIIKENDVNAITIFLVFCYNNKKNNG
jgi:hypothetical protein